MSIFPFSLFSQVFQFSVRERDTKETMKLFGVLIAGAFGGMIGGRGGMPPRYLFVDDYDKVDFCGFEIILNFKIAAVSRHTSKRQRHLLLQTGRDAPRLPRCIAQCTLWQCRSTCRF